MAKRILIVDDESDVAVYLATALRANGYDAVIAANAKTALNEVRQNRPDLISLDIVMPEESGIALYKKLKANPTSAEIPVVVVSGAGQDGTFDFRSLASDESVSEPECFFEKPIDVDEYIVMIGELTSANRGSKRKKTS
ncbi:MAG: response regulator [Candidatus Zixiibacteriota bacterium]